MQDASFYLAAGDAGQDFRDGRASSDAAPQGECPHRYLTVINGSGWMCAACRVPVLSLSMPIPLPLIARAIEAVAHRALGAQA